MGWNPLDPLGIKKKAKKKLKKEFKGTFLGDLISFEDAQLKRWGRMIKDNPEQLLIGAGTPLGGKMWSKITGKDYQPLVNMYGGPTAEMYAEAERLGIDTSNIRSSHKIAEQIAQFYAGQGLTNLAGKGLTSVGSKHGPMLTKGGKYFKTGSRLAGTGVGMAGQAMEGDYVPGETPFDPGRPYNMDPIRGSTRQFQFAFDPSSYGRSGGEYMFTPRPLAPSGRIGPTSQIRRYGRRGR